MQAERLARWEERSRPALLRFCAGYLGDPALAEDATQEVFRRALASPEEPRDSRAFLFTLARNHCLNVLRGLSRRRDGASLGAAPDWLAATAGPATRAIAGEERERLFAAFDELTPEQREALRLRYGEGLSRDDIAEITGATPAGVKERLFSGLSRLRRSLGPGD